MNRIILIGNGFDLAHELHTSYNDFIADFWQRFSENICQTDEHVTATLKTYSDDPLVDFKVNVFRRISTESFNPSEACSLTKVQEMIRDYRDHFLQTTGRDNSPSLSFKGKSSLFEAINKKLGELKWVDIENEYYRLLKAICNKHHASSGDANHFVEEVKGLNDDLKEIERKLITYLKGIQDEKKCIKNETIEDIIYEPFRPQDISNASRDLFTDFVRARFSSFKQRNFPRSLFLMYQNNDPLWMQYIEQYLLETGSPQTHENNVFNELTRRNVPDIFIQPRNIMLLSFNYTATASLYRRNGVSLNHIHGELGNENNPIIFGYGDEVDEHYRKIADLNENEYMQNIKSIRYLETDNYRKLLTFLDSAPYQIYIMGHSCGNSDRTLLNTMFEHNNCVSIKPFYYQKPDSTNDYIDIVQNISRNFKDPAIMRDRVVNLGYCSTLPQPEGVGSLITK